MTTTNPKINYRYPIKGNEKPTADDYDEKGFARFFATQHGANKSIHVEFKQNMSRTKPDEVSSITVTLSEKSGMTVQAVQKAIRENAPAAFKLVAKYTPVDNVLVSMTLENLKRAFIDVASRLYVYAPDKYTSVADAQEKIVKYYKRELGVSDEEIKFDGKLFTKICDLLLKKSDDVNKNGRDRASLLEKIQEKDSAVMKKLTTERTTKAVGKTALPALVKKSQVDSLVAQANRCFILYTPADKTTKNKDVYRFATISEGQTVPGKKDKIVGSTKTAYLPYLADSKIHTLYNSDKTNVEGETKEIKARIPTAKIAKTSDGMVAPSARTAAKAVLSASDLSLVERFKHYAVTPVGATLYSKAKVAKMSPATMLAQANALTSSGVKLPA